MEELIDINRYLHDFTSAMWICGSILLWLMLRESRRTGLSSETSRALGRLSSNLWYVTVPSLILSLASGGVRAATFAKYEHAGEINSQVITLLVAKHVIFAVVVGWGIWVHFLSRQELKAPRDL